MRMKVTLENGAKGGCLSRARGLYSPWLATQSFIWFKMLLITLTRMLALDDRSGRFLE